MAFIEKYNRAGGKDDNAAVFGYAAAETLAQVLKQCGNDLSRENVMKQAAATRRTTRAPCCCPDQNQHRPVEFSADQTSAADSIRRPHLGSRSGRYWKRRSPTSRSSCVRANKMPRALDCALPLSPPRSREAMGNQEPN